MIIFRGDEAGRVTIIAFPGQSGNGHNSYTDRLLHAHANCKCFCTGILHVH
jgi:hypothetical protein